MAWNNGYRYVECESDCQLDLNFIQDEVHTTHLYAPVIDLIKKFIDYPWLLSFHHSLREELALACIIHLPYFVQHQSRSFLGFAKPCNCSTIKSLYEVLKENLFVKCYCNILLICCTQRKS
ncbi:unnamed protein product [Trifolium pratense]|uniref:Uncharacterized protein n=1 Tax=Trifolium pratense TaxID=57577 RepID=A0ACB0L576_TRIPR|nr:unnamed protein product [Trifolium pratense]